MRLLLFLLFLLIAFAPMVAVATPTCQDGQCTFSPNYAQAKADLTAGHPVLATARRSAGFVGKAVAKPVKLIKNAVAKVRSRKHKPVIRAVAAVLHRRRCRNCD